MTETINTIHLDLDEMLISGKFCASDNTAQKKIKACSQFESFTFNTASDLYVVFIRPGAKEFVNWCRDQVGKENLYILTSSTEDYAQRVNKGAKFNIEPNNIFSREFHNNPVEALKDKNNILIDNEDYLFHSCGSVNKCSFLHGLPEKNLIQVDHFTVDFDFKNNAMPVKNSNDDYFMSVKEQVKKLLIKISRKRNTDTISV
jgi:hypothetical protein